MYTNNASRNPILPNTTQDTQRTQGSGDRPKTWGQWTRNQMSVVDTTARCVSNVTVAGIFIGGGAAGAAATTAYKTFMPVVDEVLQTAAKVSSDAGPVADRMKDLSEILNGQIRLPAGLPVLRRGLQNVTSALGDMFQDATKISYILNPDCGPDAEKNCTWEEKGAQVGNAAVEGALIGSAAYALLVSAPLMAKGFCNLAKMGINICRRMFNSENPAPIQNNESNNNSGSDRANTIPV